MFTRIWFALFGLWPWSEVPQLPVELALMRPWMPISLYTFACWARQTVMPLAVVMHYRPVRPLPPARAWRELDLGPARRARRNVWDDVDGLLKRYAGSPVKPGRRHALAVAERWILDRQERDGCWGGIQPPWVWSLIALACRGHGPDSPAMRNGLAGWEGFLVQDGDRLRPEACQSPVWDTGLALLGLRAAGVPADHAGLVKAGEWILAEEVRARGDWALRTPGVSPGGWAFEYDNDLYPDVDDAAVIGLALRELGVGRPALERACRWLAGMRSSDDGWAAFDVDNRSYWLYDVPFCDFGAVIDPPSVDVTAHVVEVLAAEPGYEDAVRRGVRYILAEQEPDGSWWGRWGVNHVYGTAAALPALEAAGVPPDARGGAARGRLAGRAAERRRRLRRGLPLVPRRRGRARLAGARRLDSLADRLGAHGARRCRRGALRDGRACSSLALRGPAVGRRLGRGAFTGTGFPRDFMIRYHLYRIVWPLIGLGRYREALRA